MRTLYPALHAEGPTDRRFLPPIISATARQIVSEQNADLIEVADFLFMDDYNELKTPGLDGAEKILTASRLACNMHILFVHIDAGAPNAKKAKKNCFDPGKALVEKATEPVCRQLIPVIPVREIEAWMLADWQTLLTEVGITASEWENVRAECGLPARPREVESILFPKLVRDQILAKAQEHLRRGRRQLQPGELYASLAPKIRLERLADVPAYEAFKTEFTNVLAQLGMIRTSR